jgi:uncharacterized protein YbjT (DUF2867 family)
MKILLTGATGYIGNLYHFNRARSRYRVLRKRYKSFFCSYSLQDKVTVVEVDFLKKTRLRDP